MSSLPDFQARLLAWYDANKRDLPWRQTHDPYAIWVSEAMAQQTSVLVAGRYWRRWMARFPDVGTLSQASEDEVLAMWQGLGYYRRARALLTGAVLLAESGVPESVEGWSRVPGVGPYTAAAVASICFGAPVPAVDGNVERVYARILADESDGKTLRDHADDWAAAMLDRRRPGDWNQALMELGALVCTPRRPDCERCPVSNQCLSRKLGLVEKFPKKRRQAERINISWRCDLVTNGSSWKVEKIEEGSWWRGMWRFPTTVGSGDGGRLLGTVKHTVTHHRITMAVYLEEVSRMTAPGKWVGPQEVAGLALPALYRKAWELQSVPTLPLAEEA